MNTSVTETFRPFETTLDRDQSIGLLTETLSGADDGELPDCRVFRRRVCARALQWQRRGLPDRAAQFYAALCDEFDNPLAFADLIFREELLQ